MIPDLRKMTLDEILQTRRSVRGYTSQTVKEEDIKVIFEAARVAPSACNSQTWRFIAVTDRALIQKIAQEGMRPVVRNAWIETAPLIIIGCSQLDILANRVGSLITGIEYYQVDLGIAMEHLVLKATELGLGTCWIGWFKEKKIKEVLEIPKTIKVLALLTVGYPKDNETTSVKKRKPLGEIFYREKWRGK
jgi:nitroreductase